ncbi:MAG: Holliday junction branch migration protein RuvA [Rikenellaceae bacterium]
MYEYIKGELVSLSPTTAIIEAAGVGYNLSISLTTNDLLKGQAQAKLYTHLYTVQDGAATLFGFYSQMERALFRLLISVSGIGGGTARIMLSSHTPEELVTIISTGNVAMLTKVKGIGAKTAEVIIVKLRDKVLSLGYSPDEVASITGTIESNDTKASEALEALLVLGFSRMATQKVIKKVLSAEPELSVEDIIRKTLSLL